MAHLPAADLLEAEVQSGRLGAATLLLARHGQITAEVAFGRLAAHPAAPAVRPDSVFILGSIAKPVTVAALMLLIERGQADLDDRVDRHLPEFRGGERSRVRLRDLLRHTSGLPDMLPENAELRRRHASLADFFAETLQTPLLYSPGSQFLYSSMGTLLAAVIVERLAGQPLPGFVRQEIFLPLGMAASSFGLGGRAIEATVQCARAPGLDPADEARFGPNTAYWRNLAAPWGCMHSNAADLAILLHAFLAGGSRAGRRIWAPATVAAMISDQNTALAAPWGLGWALARAKAWNVFGGLVAPGTFGHTGSPGTLAWADPTTQQVCVVLTNRNYAADDGRLLRQVSNAVAASARAGDGP
jgi:CubicO group peptidase (beta-lactamase class C family)